MTDAITLGPLLLPLELLLVAAAAAITLLVGRRLGKAAPAAVESVLWRTLLAGLLGARLAFVLEYRTLYLASPLTMLDIRDGGWNPGVGLAAAWLYAIHRWRATPLLAQPIRLALAAGTAVFVIGTALLAFRMQDGRTMPELTLTSIEGESVALTAFVGKPAVVNLWATWCPPCVREMPVLSQAQAERPDVHFVFLNQGEAATVVRRWLDGQGLALRNVLIDEPRRASAAFKQQGYPTTLFFDAQGRLVSRRVGELSAATLNERLRQIAK